MKELHSETALMNYSHPSIRKLIKERNWASQTKYDRISKAYAFVRDEIAFGYNKSDELSASQVLNLGYGQCNTKAILLMGLFRSLNIPCRIHGFLVDKSIKRGVLNGLFYRLAPRQILHSWVEVQYENRWINLEGFILDKPYIQAIQTRFPKISGPFTGFGMSTTSLRNPQIEWVGKDTFVQSEGIIDDLGLYDTPDQFLKEHQQNMGLISQYIYKYIVRHVMNLNISRLRRGVLQLI